MVVNWARIDSLRQAADNVAVMSDSGDNEKQIVPAAPVANPDSDATQGAPASRPDKPIEIGGRDGLDPTRYGDWEKAGRCIDF